MALADGGRLIARRAWLDRRRVRSWWALGMLAYAAMILAVWPSLEGSDSFADVAQDYPDAIKALFGGSEAFDAITTPAGFINTYIFSFMLPLLMMALASAAGASLLAGEDEDGRLQLLLAQPVARTAAVLAKAAVVIAEVVLVVAVVVVLIAVFGPLVDLDVGLGGLTAAGLGSALFGGLHGGIALLAGALTGRRSTAMGVAIVVGVGGYLLSSLAELASWLEPFRFVSPMYHAVAGDPVSNGVPVTNYVVLAVAVAAVIIAAVAVFRGHDLH
ncbi:MAG: ABC transporter permease subunit [Acidimicrobiia bacterium]|nr:ABC transporter permease subunit [Acidimicrobiia bacterium]